MTTTAQQTIQAILIESVPSALDYDEPWQDVKEIEKASSRGELGSSELLTTIYKNRIAFDHTDRQWYMWNGDFWEHDKRNLITNLVSNQLSAQFTHAAAMLTKQNRDDNTIKRLFGFASGVRFRHAISNVLSLATSQPDLSLSGEEWDSDPWLLGCKNGVIDLRNGEHRIGHPKDYLRTIAPTNWNGLGELCPMFEKFMGEIFGGDVELVNFVQRLLGYGLTGLTVDHYLPIFYGEDGRNGKGVLLRVLRDVLGDYAGPVGEEVMLSGKKSPGAASPYTVALRFLRIAHVSETSEGDILEAGRVKLLTGGDELTARQLHANPITFTPKHLLLLITNHKPHINADDMAIWERVLLIPFLQRFIDDPTEPNEFQRDPNLASKLKQERSGILTWLVRGCLAWQSEGLNPPNTVKLATETYRQSEDTLGEFISECCKIDDPNLEIKSSGLYEGYKQWSKDGGMKPMTITAFGKRMKKRFSHYKKGTIFYTGVAFNGEFYIKMMNLPIKKY